MASNNIAITISAKDDASSVLRSVGNALDNTSERSSRFRESLSRIRDTALGVYLPQVAAQVLDIGKSAVMAAADYEQSLNVFRSVSGATAAQMQEVGARARALGNDISLPGISAKDAALAMVELAKAGLSVNDTMAASKGVLSLAKAGQLDTADAAEIAANALNAFHLQGSEATRVADLLAGAANASSADVRDLAYGLQMSSASAAAMKIPIEDLTTLLGEMSNNGIQGSDAGTSLKTMFANLTPSTVAARDAFKEMNLDFFDAKGNFVGMRDVIKQLQAGTKDLTDEQRAQALETAFGSDSIRAANVLIKEGVDGYDRLRGAVTKQGAATQLAAAQNSGFNGALDALKSSLETVAVDAGTKVLPVLTTLALTLAGSVQPAAEAVGTAIAYLSPKFGEAARQVADYLGPKLGELWQTVQVKLLPVLERLWHKVIEPLGSALGTVLVGAFGLVLDMLNQVLPPLLDFANWMIDNKEIVAAMALAILGIRAALNISDAIGQFKAGFSDGMNTAGGKIDEVSGKQRGLKGLLGNKLLMGGVAVEGALADIALVMEAVKAVQGAIDAMNNAREAAESDAKNTAATREDMKRLAANGSPDQKKRANDWLNRFGRAAGGPVMGGQSYLVGENGPELFTPATSGSVTNNSVDRGVTVQIMGGVSVRDDTDIEQLARRIASMIDRSGAQVARGLAG